VLPSFLCKKFMLKIYPIVEIRLQNTPVNAYIDEFFKPPFHELLLSLYIYVSGRHKSYERLQINL